MSVGYKRLLKAALVPTCSCFVFFVSASAVTDSFNLFAAGDIMLGRKVGKALRKKGATYPFEVLQPIISKADIAFANLESPITPNGQLVHPKNRMIFSAEPFAVKGLVFAGFDVLSVANNHATDFGIQSLYDTIDILRENGIMTCGGGRTYEEAHQPALLTVNGITVAFLAYNEVPGPQRARPGQGGVAWVDIFVARRDVQKTKAFTEVVIVSMHMGKEYVHFPQGFYHKTFVRDFARSVIDAGADLVLGHHPHTPQGIGFYKGKLIAYSLGNFVFDQREPWRHSICLWLRVNRKGVVDIPKVLPIYIHRFQPRPSQGIVREKMIVKMRKISWTPLLFPTWNDIIDRG
ncbi:MAG: CapA family protein [Armatimonadetes bacterium]|nr:CapA family protein [Armatimonadota bacterium]MDW8121041.1 CapA family protein [Armatimonadota bacterium]